MNPQIITVANQKGDVGKTTSCTNFGIGLAKPGRKCCWWTTPLTISLGNPQSDKLPFALSDAMGRILMNEPLHPGEDMLADNIGCLFWGAWEPGKVTLQAESQMSSWRKNSSST